MKKLTIVRGLPFSERSGKAKKLAEKRKTVRVSYTSILKTLGGASFDEERRRMAYNAAYAAMRDAFRRGYSVVYDEYNLETSGLAPFITLANEMGASVEFISVNTPLEDCLAEARRCGGSEECVKYYHGLYHTLLEQ